MDTLLKSTPKERRLFNAVGEFTGHGAPIVIPCQKKRVRRLRWAIVVAVLVGLWGVAMASQLASNTLLHQGAPVLSTLDTTHEGG